MEWLRQLQPDLDRIYGTITQRRDQVPQDPKSSTVRLLNTGWISPANQAIDTQGKPVKLFGIGDKLVEEAVEIGRAKERLNIVLESSQALYYIEVGLVKEGFTNQQLYGLIEQVETEQASFRVDPDKIAEQTGAAIARVALTGVAGNHELLLRRSAEAVVGLHRFWEFHGITPAEVGKII